MNQSILRIDLGFVNAYLLKANDGYLLIDTGIADVWTQLESKLLELGCLPKKLNLVILTHGDKDHAGNCRTLQQKYNVAIAMHRGDIEMARTGRSPDRHANTLSGRFTLWFDRRIPVTYNSFEPNVYLKDAQPLESYGLSAQILHTPGHTPGSISILTDNGELFVGDTFSNHKNPRAASIIENDEDLLKSYENIRQLKARIVYPGHGKPFSFEKIEGLVKKDTVKR